MKPQQLLWQMLLHTVLQPQWAPCQCVPGPGNVCEASEHVCSREWECQSLLQLRARCMRVSRYKEITTFLAETEQYLSDLSATIMQRKLREVEERAFATALAEARSNGVPDEAAEKDAMRAAKEAKENCSFTKLSEDHAGDAQVRSASSLLRPPHLHAHRESCSSLTHAVCMCLCVLLPTCLHVPCRQV